MENRECGGFGGFFGSSQILFFIIVFLILFWGVRGGYGGYV